MSLLKVKLDTIENADWIKKLPGHKKEVEEWEQLISRSKTSKKGLREEPWVTEAFGTPMYFFDKEKLKGGPGSGHYGHAGRPGKRGGSIPGTGMVSGDTDDAELSSRVRAEVSPSFSGVGLGARRAIMFPDGRVMWSRDEQYHTPMFARAMLESRLDTSGMRYFQQEEWKAALEKARNVIQKDIIEDTSVERAAMKYLGLTSLEWRAKGDYDEDLSANRKSWFSIEGDWGAPETQIKKMFQTVRGMIKRGEISPDDFEEIHISGGGASGTYSFSDFEVMAGVRKTGAENTGFWSWEPVYKETREMYAGFIDTLKGGPGSGHFGHAGRPGKHGGSAPGSGVISNASPTTVRRRRRRRRTVAAQPKYKPTVTVTGVMGPKSIGPDIRGNFSINPVVVSRNKVLVEEAFELIRKVHGDGGIVPYTGTTIPINQDSRRSAALTVSNRRTNRIMELSVSRASGTDLEPSSICHEIGHVIYQSFYSGDIGQDPQTYIAFTQLLAKLVGDPTAVSRLRVLSQQNTVGFNRPGGAAPYFSRPSRKFVNYLLETTEIFARAYAQYIVTRAKHGKSIKSMEPRVEPKVTDETATQIALAYPSQWTKQEFKPYLKMFDDLFRRLQWRQK